MKTYKLKLRLGTAEFEAEGDQRFVEKHLESFKPHLKLEGKTSKAESPARRPGRRVRKAKPAAQEYPAAAVVSLKAFIAKAKPKGQPSTAVAFGAHHLQHFKTPSFKNQDVLAAAKAVGFKFTNLPLSLMAAAKQGKVRKVKKGTWRLANPAAKPTKPAKKRAASKSKPAVKPAKGAAKTIKNVQKSAIAKKPAPVKKTVRKPTPSKKPAPKPVQTKPEPPIPPAEPAQP